MSVITKTFKIDGVLTDMTSVKLSSYDGSFGVKRTDTDAVVVPDGTTMVKTATGTYQYEFTDPADNLTYEFVLEYVYGGETYWLTDTFVGPATTDYRTTVALVSGIIEVEAGITVTPFIEAANALVTELCAPVTDYDATRLELIERWLAAHFYAIRDPRRSSESVGPVKEAYQYKVKVGLQVTTYGQQVMLLDTEGALARLNRSSDEGTQGGTASVVWAGSDLTVDEDE
jgi:hypothetical protein